MNRSFDEELLSAYFDGELDAAERETVEQWLARSPEARESLQHFRRLSVAIREIRVQPLSDQFPVRMMELIEREALFGADTQRAAARLRRPGAAAGGWLPRGGLRLSLAAACAVVLAAVVVWWPRGGSVLVGRHDGGFEMPDGDVPAAAPGAGFGAAGMVSTEEAPAAVSESAGSGIGGAADVAVTSNAAAPTPAEVSDTDGMLFYVVRRDDDGRQLWLRQSPEDLRIGDVVEAMAADDDKVALVQLNVVDRVEGLKRLQLLLAANSIAAPVAAKAAAPPGVAAVEKAVSDRPKPAADRGADHGASDAGLIAVYVETDATNLRTALLRMLEEPEFREIAIGPQVQWAALGDDVQRQVAAVRSQVAEAQGANGSTPAISAARRRAAAAAQLQSRSSAPRVAALKAAPAPTLQAADSPPEAKGRRVTSRRSPRRVAAFGAGSPNASAKDVAAAVAEAPKPKAIGAPAAPGNRPTNDRHGSSPSLLKPNVAAASGGGAPRPSDAREARPAPGTFMSYQVPLELPESVLQTTQRIMENRGRSVAADTTSAKAPRGRTAAIGKPQEAARKASETARASVGVAAVNAGAEGRAGDAVPQQIADAAGRPATLPMPKRVLFLVIEQPAESAGTAYQPKNAGSRRGKSADD